jgi:hypothetical protein
LRVCEIHTLGIFYVSSSDNRFGLGSLFLIIVVELRISDLGLTFILVAIVGRA